MCRRIDCDACDCNVFFIGSLAILWFRFSQGRCRIILYIQVCLLRRRYVCSRIVELKKRLFSIVIRCFQSVCGTMDRSNKEWSAECAYNRCNVLKIEMMARDIGYARAAGNKWIRRQNKNSSWQRRDEFFSILFFFSTAFASKREGALQFVCTFSSMLKKKFCRHSFHFFLRFGSIIWFH